MAESKNGMLLGGEAFYGEICGSLMIKREKLLFVSDSGEKSVFVTVPCEAVRSYELTENGKDLLLSLHCLGEPKIVEFRLMEPVSEWKRELPRVLPANSSREMVAESAAGGFVHAFVETEDEYFARTHIGRE